MARKKMHPLLLIGIIIGGLLVLNHYTTNQSISGIDNQAGEGGNSVNTCFDYIDNDNDGLLDLYDEDCYWSALDDFDNDGWKNIDEWEQNSNVFSASSYPKVTSCS